jgi:hypothetical protein
MKKRLCISALLFLFSFYINAQIPEDQHIRWGEEDSTSYVVMKNGKFGMVMEGKETIPAKYDIENFMSAIIWDGNAYFSDGADFVLGLDGKWGVMNNRGVIKVPFEYDHIEMERDQTNQQMEYAGVEKNGKVAIMDGKGKLLTGFEFDAFFGYYKNGYQMSFSFTKLAVQKGNKVLFFDPQTKKLLAKNNDTQTTPRAKIIEYKNKRGVINRDGELLLPAEYDQIFSADGADFKEQSQPLSIGKNGKYGIWQYGKGIILPLEYGSARCGLVQNKMYFVVSKNEMYALLNTEGKNITEYMYSSMYIYENKIVGVKEGHDFNIDTNGKATLVTD